MPPYKTRLGFLALRRDIFGSSQISDKKIMAYAWPTNCYGSKKIWLRHVYYIGGIGLDQVYFERSDRVTHACLGIVQDLAP